VAGSPGAGYLPDYPKGWVVGAPCSGLGYAEQRPAALVASTSAHSVNTTCLLLRMHSSQALGWLLLLNTAGGSLPRVNCLLEVLAEDGSRSVSGPCLDNVLSCRNALAGEDARGVRWHVWGMPGSLGQANCTLGKSAFQVMSPVGASTTTRGGASPCCLGARVDGHYFVVAACCRASCVSRGLRRGEWWR
jgi:hypothetical protein